MQKKKKPLVLTTNHVKVLVATDLSKVEGGCHVPPKFNTSGN